MERRNANELEGKNHEPDDREEITLEDVKIAIKILAQFMNEYRKAEILMKRFSTLTSKRASRPEDRIMEFILEQQKKQSRAEEPEETEDFELSEDELKRLEELKKRYSE